MEKYDRNLFHDDLLDELMAEKVCETIIEALTRIRSELKDRTDINPERLQVLHGVRDRLGELFGTAAEHKLHPTFSSGGVCAEMPELHLEREQLSELREILRDCATLSVVLLAGGGLRVGATVTRLYGELEDPLEW